MAFRKESLFSAWLWLALGAVAVVAALFSFSEATSRNAHYAPQGIGFAILAAALWLGAVQLHVRRPPA